MSMGIILSKVTIRILDLLIRWGNWNWDCALLPDEGAGSGLGALKWNTCLWRTRGYTRWFLPPSVFCVTSGGQAGRVGEVSKRTEGLSLLTAPPLRPWVRSASMCLCLGQVCRDKWHRWAIGKRWEGKATAVIFPLSFIGQDSWFRLDSSFACWECVCFESHSFFILHGTLKEKAAPEQNLSGLLTTIILKMGLRSPKWSNI